MVGFLMAAALLAGAQAAGPPSVVHQYHGVAIAPRGDRVAAVEFDALLNSEADPHGAVMVRNRSDGAILAALDPCPTCSYGEPAWSPSGDALAFVASDRKAKTATLYVARDGKIETIATLAGLLDEPRWAPDGLSISLLATDHPRKQTGATQAGAPVVGEIGSATDEQRIAVVAASGGELRFVSPADTFVYEYDWTPDSRGFVATEAKGDGDNNWWIARLATISLSGAIKEIATPPVQMKYPRVSPDGATVAFIGGLMSDFGPTGGDLYTVPITGGVAVDRTPEFKGSFSSLIWRKRALFATALVGDNTALMTVDPATGATHPLYAAQASLTAGEGRVSIDRDGRQMATVSETFGAAPSIQTGPLTAPRPITHENDSVAPQVSARSITWKSGPYDVQGWLIGPTAAAQPGKTYPMIVQVHGGPSSAAQPSYTWKGTVQDFVAHGYYVFLPNPRGSFGQGEAFTRANVKDFGGGDLTDILAGVDAVEKVAPIDDKRLGVFGHSYGGFMTMWTVTHSQRFKAAVAGAGIANWVSYYGQNGIDQWMVPFFGATAYDDAIAYDRASPIRAIKAAKTPTFIYVGERDVECPPAQSVEFWHGLQAMNVPTSLMIYEGEGHGIRAPDHRLDLQRRILSWFDKYLGQP